MDDLGQAIRQSRPGKWECFMLKIPFVGCGLASDFEQCRFKPIVNEIEKRLKGRIDSEVEECWNKSSHNYETALSLMDISQHSIGWSKSRFLPNDPLLVVFWGHEDGLDWEEARLTIEHRFGLSLTEEEFIQSEEMSFGEFVEFIDNKRVRKEGANRRGQAKFS